MPSIIEFAVLHLPTPTTSSTPALLRALGPVTSIIQSASTLPTRFFTDLNDPHVMYVIGGWPSVEAHRDGFEGSETQAGLWPLLDGMMEIKWMEYLAVEEGRLPEDKDRKADAMETGRCLGVAVWKVGVLEGNDGRETVEEAVKRDFEGEAERGLGKLVWAWNIKKGKADREGAMLVGFAGLEVMAAERWADKVRKLEVSGLDLRPEVFVMQRTLLGADEK
jgi:hypothetical protein